MFWFWHGVLLHDIPCFRLTYCVLPWQDDFLWHKVFSFDRVIFIYDIPCFRMTYGFFRLTLDFLWHKVFSLDRVMFIHDILCFRMTGWLFYDIPCFGLTYCVLAWQDDFFMTYGFFTWQGDFYTWHKLFWLDRVLFLDAWWHISYNCVRYSKASPVSALLNLQHNAFNQTQIERKMTELWPFVFPYHSSNLPCFTGYTCADLWNPAMS